MPASFPNYCLWTIRFLILWDLLAEVVAKQLFLRTNVYVLRGEIHELSIWLNPVCMWSYSQTWSYPWFSSSKGAVHHKCGCSWKLYIWSQLCYVWYRTAYGYLKRSVDLYVRPINDRTAKSFTEAYVANSGPVTMESAESSLDVEELITAFNSTCLDIMNVVAHLD